MLALQNTPFGAYCNASMLYLVTTCQEYKFRYVNFVFRGLTLCAYALLKSNHFQRCANFSALIDKIGLYF